MTTWLAPIENYGTHATLDFQRGLDRLENRTVAIEATVLDVLESSSGLRVLLSPMNFERYDDAVFLLDIDESDSQLILQDMHKGNWGIYLVAAKLRDLSVLYTRGHNVYGVDSEYPEDAEVEHSGLEAQRILRGALVAIELQPQ